MIIDLRSDTVTKPTSGMLDAMMSAEVGDDVFGTDPTVNALEEKVAKMFGMEAAIYCPSGTMTNQIAVKVNTQPGDEIICDTTSHIYRYEGGGAMFNSQASVRLLHGDLGRFQADDVARNINPDDIHFPVSRMVSVENTVNKGGGCIFPLESIQEIEKVAREHDLKMHMDGARLFNALMLTGESPEVYGKLFDTISICFSKGLGAPVGSVLLGSKESVKKARRIRKVFGGGMRQAGFLAAACIYALDHQVERLREDHDRAKKIAQHFQTKAYVEDVLYGGTNIVILDLSIDVSVDELLKKWESKGLLAVPFGPHQVRFVTHLDFTDEHLEEMLRVVD